jgi:MFS family permease
MNKEKTSSKNTSRFRSIARALSYRNFRLFFAGQSISLIGTWMQRIALGWLVYRLTNSAFLLGFVGFAGQLPTFLFSSFAGVLADRMNRHRLLILTQAMAMIQALILALLVLMGSVLIWHIILLSILLGLINAVDVPVRQSFMVEMVERKEDYGNVIALNSSMVNGARLIGPSIAGILIAAVGEGVCFLINGISYLAVIVALFAMHITRKNIIPKSSHVWRDLKEGFAYAFGFAPIRAILLLLSLVSLMGMSYAVLMPIIAKDILHGGPHTLGFLMGAAGVGALIGALSLASRESVLGLGKWIVRGAAVLGIGLILTSLSRVVWLSIILLLLIGFGMMVQMASSNTVLQTIVDDDKRGRVMSFYAMAFMGMAPFGSLIAGSLASKIGAPNMLIIGGICCLIASAVFASRLPTLRKIVQPIYVKMGIIPEIATGIQSASDLTISQKRL